MRIIKINNCLIKATFFQIYFNFWIGNFLFNFFLKLKSRGKMMTVIFRDFIHVAYFFRDTSLRKWVWPEWFDGLTRRRTLAWARRITQATAVCCHGVLDIWSGHIVVIVVYTLCGDLLCNRFTENSLVFQKTAKNRRPV